MTELSPATRGRIAALFDPSDIATAEAMLLELPAGMGVERGRFAAVRYSGGELDRLRNAIELGTLDWRDLVMAAGFGDVDAHERWQPARFDAEVSAAWLAGRLPTDVAFPPRAPVKIGKGIFRRDRGTVRALIGLEPMPRYRVLRENGHEMDAFQRQLQPTQSFRPRR